MTTFAEILTQAQSYASNTLTGAYNQLQNALAVLGSLVDPGGPNPPSIAIVVPEPFEPGEAPLYNGTRWSGPTLEVSAPVLQNLPSLVFTDIPPREPTTIEFVEPVRPTGGPSSDIIGPAPNVGETLVVPPAPNLLAEIRSIPVPNITPITVDSPPPYVAPPFTGIRPNITVTTPTDLDITFRNAFQASSQEQIAVSQEALEAFLDRDFPQFREAIATLEAKLATFLAGGTALSEEVEDRIFSRLQDKISTDGQRARDAALEDYRRAGWTMFAPTLAANLAKVEQDMRDNLGRGATEIAIKQAELEQDNVKYALAQTITFRQTALSAAMQFYSGVIQSNGQAIEYAKGVVQAIVATYEVATKIAEIQVRIYEGDARVFEARLKGAMAVIEAYKAKIDGLLAQADVDTALVNQYKARIEAVQAEATVYRATIEGLSAQAQIKRLFVEIYQARTSAYVAQVNAQTAQWQAYEAATRGETARINALKAQEEIALAQVQAQVEIVKARTMQVDAIARANQATVSVYTAQVQAFSALVDAEAKAIQAEVSSFDATLRAYVANCQAQSEHSKAEVAGFQVSHQAMIETAKLYYQNLIERSKIHLDKIKAAASIHAEGAKEYAEVAKAALSGMNTVASDQTSRTE